MSVLTISKNFKLTHIEKLIIRFIETKPRKFVEQTINELAATLFISVGTITQLTKKLGFNNFKELKKFVIEWLKLDKENNLYNENDQIENINLLYAHSIEKTLAILDVAQINRIVDTILKMEKIITFGIGSSLIAATELANNLRNLHLNSFAAKSITDIAAWIDKPANTCLVIFSVSTTSKDTIAISKLLKQQQINSIFITSNIELGQNLYSEVVYFDILEQNNSLFAVGSKIAQLLIADLIALKIQGKINIFRSDFFNEFKRIWYRKIKND
ncbi:MurR/RpiR family transcriptional regulator [Mycoplasma flocculare]|uniref:MurR/RpiR family transcriptional regulator n=1 Tax=Mesomycoplasma flocculare TaxID=2128 RepID=A0AAW9XEZ2_MESFC|nr:MurR/RpiR family transcriptional regulator [Mesomycoplasma flocculare]MXR06131.1 MurR/RpiR family transcriptional regulator [Mesomycoplasma flocculare]MXR12387.1 MurR/RpiR family transcriptional regulator [Mesomycoplasma flocculare]MXR39687.1 MurR/RpiR family transcriptional regulator [Mycoplasma sp. MF12]MXR56928.1 MurR/RpiR family transcriptional regulator [Mesomycoplasma flocculare]